MLTGVAASIAPAFHHDLQVPYLVPLDQLLFTHGMAKLIGNVTYYFRYLVLIEPAGIVPRRMLIQAGFTLSARATAAN